MVVIEGVARELADDINIWELAKPLVSQWMMENMGPKAQLEFLADDLKHQIHDWMVLPARMESILNHVETRQALTPQHTSRLPAMLGTLCCTAGGGILTAYYLELSIITNTWGLISGISLLLIGTLLVAHKNQH